MRRGGKGRRDRKNTFGGNSKVRISAANWTVCDWRPKTTLKDIPCDPGPGSVQPPPASQVPAATSGEGGAGYPDRLEHLYSAKSQPSGRPSTLPPSLPQPCLFSTSSDVFPCLRHLLLFPLLGIRFGLPGLGFSSEHRHSLVLASSDTTGPTDRLDFGTGLGRLPPTSPASRPGLSHVSRQSAQLQDFQKAGPGATQCCWT